MYFRFNDSIYELLYLISHSNTNREDIFDKIRKNTKLHSKQYGIDSEKFIFNDDFLTRIKKEDGIEK